MAWLGSRGSEAPRFDRHVELSNSGLNRLQIKILIAFKYQTIRSLAINLGLDAQLALYHSFTVDASYQEETMSMVLASHPDTRTNRIYRSMRRFPKATVIRPQSSCSSTSPAGTWVSPVRFCIRRALNTRYRQDPS